MTVSYSLKAESLLITKLCKLTFTKPKVRIFYSIEQGISNISYLLLIVSNFSS